MEDAVEVGREDSTPHREPAGGAHLRFLADAGVCDEHVDLSDRVEGAGGGGFVAHIELGTGQPQHLESVGRQSRTRRGADAPRRPGHHRLHRASSRTLARTASIRTCRGTGTEQASTGDHEYPRMLPHHAHLSDSAAQLTCPGKGYVNIA
jgi:hypothetical protein